MYFLKSRRVWTPSTFQWRGLGGKLPVSEKELVEQWKIPCGAKLLQTDSNDFRMIYGVTDTNFN